MLLLAAAIIALFALMVALSLQSTKRKARHLKCLCRFKSTTPEEDVGFIQKILHQDGSIDVSRVTRRTEVNITVFEIEYSTDRPTQARVLSLMRARDSLCELHVLSGSGADGNVIFMSREISQTRARRKEARASRYQSEHQQKRRRY